MANKAKSEALENKRAGKAIGKVIADRRAFEKRTKLSAFPFHQAKALEKKYPKQTEAHGKAKGPKGEYFK